MLHPVRISGSTGMVYTELDDDTPAMLLALPWVTDDGQYVKLSLWDAEGQPRAVWLHRLINGTHGLSGLVTHHRDGCPLRNVAENLQSLTRAEHCKLHTLLRGPRGKLGLKGVDWDPTWPALPYRASIRVEGRRRWLGRFATAEEAGAAYDRAVLAGNVGYWCWVNGSRGPVLAPGEP